MSTKRSLQKFTETETKVDKVKWLFGLEKVTVADLEKLSAKEKKKAFELMNKKYPLLKGEELDKFVEQFIDVWNNNTKNQLWESNHIKITRAISFLMEEYGRMPTKMEIADKTELSRQTIHKHLKEYTTNPLYLGEIEQFRFMTSKVLSKVYQFAVNGDTGAAKLYFNVMGFLNNGQSPKNTLIQNQNNYIQINGTVLSQETIKHLNPEQLNTIETILKSALTQPEVLEIETPK